MSEVYTHPQPDHKDDEPRATGDIYNPQDPKARHRLGRTILVGATVAAILAGGGYALGNRGDKVEAKAPPVATAPANPSPEATPTTAFETTLPADFKYEVEGISYESGDDLIDALAVSVEQYPTGPEALEAIVNGGFNKQLYAGASVEEHKDHRLYQPDPAIAPGGQSLAHNYDELFTKALFANPDTSLSKLVGDNHVGFVGARLASVQDVKPGEEPALRAQYNYKGHGLDISNTSEGVTTYRASDVKIGYTDNGATIPRIAAEREADGLTANTDITYNYTITLEQQSGKWQIVNAESQD